MSRPRRPPPTRVVVVTVLHLAALLSWSSHECAYACVANRGVPSVPSQPLVGSQYSAASARVAGVPQYVAPGVDSGVRAAAVSSSGANGFGSESSLPSSSGAGSPGPVAAGAPLQPIGGGGGGGSGSQLEQSLLGPRVQTGEFSSNGYNAEGGGPVAQSDALRCDFEGRPCCWANVPTPDDQIDWHAADGVTESQTFRNVTIEGRYLVAYAAGAAPSDEAQFASCAIGCAQSPIRVRARHWQSANVLLQVCQRESFPNTVSYNPLLNCQEYPMTQGIGFTEMELPKASLVDIVFVASNFVSDQGDIAVLDNIEILYENDPRECEKINGRTATPAGGVSPLPSSSAGTTRSAGAGGGDNVDTGSLPESAFSGSNGAEGAGGSLEPIAETSVKGSDEWGVADGATDSDGTSLARKEGTELRAQSRNNVESGVDGATGEGESGSGAGSRAAGVSSFSSSSAPALSAGGGEFGGGSAGGIWTNSSSSATSNNRSSSSSSSASSSKTALVTEEEEEASIISSIRACQRLKCTFEEGSTCHYSDVFEMQGRDEQDVKEGLTTRFQVVKGQFMNRVTGVPKSVEGDYYAATFLYPRERAGLVADTRGHMAKDRRLRFQYYEGTHGVQLKGCCDTVDTCPFSSDKFVTVSDRMWKFGSFACPHDTQKVIFLCENTRTNQGACALDDVQVVENNEGITLTDPPLC